MTNRKSHTPFRLVPKSMTLDGLERPICILFQNRCLSEPTTKNWMKIDPHYQWQKCSPLALVSGDIRFTRIFIGILWRGGVKRQWGNRKRRFSGLLDATSSHLRKWGQHYYIVLFSPMSPFQWPQNVRPWMTLTGYLASNSVFVPVCPADTERLRKNNCVKTNKDGRILSVVQISGRDSSFWRYKVCADIWLGSLERRR